MHFYTAVLSDASRPVVSTDFILLPSKGLPAKLRCFTVQSSTSMPANQVKLSPYSGSMAQLHSSCCYIPGLCTHKQFMSCTMAYLCKLK